MLLNHYAGDHRAVPVRENVLLQPEPEIEPEDSILERIMNIAFELLVAVAIGGVIGACFFGSVFLSFESLAIGFIAGAIACVGLCIIGSFVTSEDNNDGIGAQMHQIADQHAQLHQLNQEYARLQQLEREQAQEFEEMQRQHRRHADDILANLDARQDANLEQIPEGELREAAKASFEAQKAAMRRLADALGFD